MHTSSAGNITRLLTKQEGHVHFVGICGVGMAGLAFLLKARGFKVSGCDLVPGQMAEWLEKRGILVRKGHGPEHAGAGVNWAIRTAAVGADSPEILQMKKRGIPVFARGTVLPELIKGFVSVAVGGTHGKTTTTTFITQLLKHAGKQPSWCIGGEAETLGGVAGFRGQSRPGTKGKAEEDIIVVEADESDGTLALYEPDIAVVTNVEFDHMEHFESVKSFEACFRRYIDNARRKTVFCLDDPRAAKLCRESRSCVSYGFKKSADVRAIKIHQTFSTSTFVLERRGKELGSIRLPVPGIHNVSNALAAATVGFEMGLSFAQIKKGLAGVCLPRRRFECIADKGGVRVISDYAHHPSEIAALMRLARGQKHSRILAVFQPHRYTRTLALGAEFPSAFAGVDELVLVPVYPASEKPIQGGMIWDLYENFRSQIADCRLKKVSTAESLADAWAYFKGQLKKGDLFLVVGAGDVEKIAWWAKEKIADCRTPNAEFRRFGAGTRVKINEPLGKKTTMNVGGAADVFIETGSLKDLKVLLGWVSRTHVPFRVLGGGSNVVVSDLGVRGVTARLSGGDFGAIRMEDGKVVAGAGVPISRLLVWLEERGFWGLEFLEGIPGTVGGAVRMNAGAWRHEIKERISSIRCLNLDGSECKVSGKSAGFCYRDCSFLRGRILLEAVFSLSRSGPGEARRCREEIAAKRKWMKGLRSAGSVFKNPKGAFAWRLIEKAGFKGARIGGAVVSPVHANVIVTEPGACSSDVIALMEKVRMGVFSKYGIELEMEVKILG